MRFYGSIQKVDAEKRMVYGYASTEAKDISGETILKSAVDDALEDYMKFANIREMHQLSAVGTTTEAEVDDKGLYIGAHVVDDNAWAKVQAGVYKGFSVGGKTLARDPKDKKIITKIGLYEISLVDRPQNPEATFDVWKAAHTDGDDMATNAKTLEKAEAAVAEAEKVIGTEATDDVAKAAATATAPAEPEATPEAEAAPETAAEPDAAAKVLDVVKAMGGQVEALAAKIAGEPELQKGMYGVANFADVLTAISWLVADAESEATFEGDGSKVSAALRGWLKAGAAIFKDMAKEEVDELVGKGKAKKAAEAVGLAKVAAEAAGGKIADAAADALAKAEAATSALAKAASEHEAALAKVLAERDATLNSVAAHLEPLAKRIAELEAMPMPSKTAGPGAAHAVSKEADAAGEAVEKTSGMNDADLAKVWGSMSEEDRTLAAIKASRQFPQRVAYR